MQDTLLPYPDYSLEENAISISPALLKPSKWLNEPQWTCPSHQVDYIHYEPRLRDYIIFQNEFTSRDLRFPNSGWSYLLHAKEASPP